MGQVRCWKPEGVGGLRQGARALAAWDVQGGAQRRSCAWLSLSWRTVVSRGPAGGLLSSVPPGQ